MSYQLFRQGGALFFSLQTALCESREQCFPALDILKDLLLPLPQRKPDGSVEFPKMDLDEIFSMRQVLKAAKMAAAANADKALGAIEKELGLPEVRPRSSHFLLFLVLHNLLLFLRAFSPCCPPTGALPQCSGLGLNLWSRLASILPNYRPQNWHKKSPLPRVVAITSVCLSPPLNFSSAKLTILVSTSPAA